jgi:hypothetical protein
MWGVKDMGAAAGLNWDGGMNQADVILGVVLARNRDELLAEVLQNRLKHQGIFTLANIETTAHIIKWPTL